MRESSSVRLSWSSARGPGAGGGRRLAAGLLAGGRRLGLTLGQLGIKLGLFALEALLGARFDLGLGGRDGGQPVFSALDLRGQIHALGHAAPIGRFGQREHLLHFGLELGLDLLGVPIRERAVSAGVGVDLGTVQAHGAKARELVLAGDLQHLHEGIGELIAETAAERRQRVVVRMLVARDEAEGQRVVRGPLDLAARMGSRRVAVDQQRQQQRRVVGIATATRVGALQCRQVQPFHHIDHVARQVRFGQPVLHRRW